MAIGALHYTQCQLVQTYATRELVAAQPHCLTESVFISAQGVHAETD